jgi:hypothetical protein
MFLPSNALIKLGHIDVCKSRGVLPAGPASSPGRSLADVCQGVLNGCGSYFTQDWQAGGLLQLWSEGTNREIGKSEPVVEEWNANGRGLTVRRFPDGRFEIWYRLGV